MPILLLRLAKLLPGTQLRTPGTRIAARGGGLIVYDARFTPLDESLAAAKSISSGPVAPYFVDAKQGAVKPGSRSQVLCQHDPSTTSSGIDHASLSPEIC